LGFSYLDTGAMYRAAALLLSREGIPFEDPNLAASIVRRHSIDMDGVRVFLDGEDVSGLIRTPEIAEAASRISSGAPLRRVMVSLQRSFGEKHDTVAEGRDMGTVVFPDADLKVYVVADVAIRVVRRWLELKRKGDKPDFDALLRSQLIRDRRDRDRKDSPLRMAPGAVMLDSTLMTIREQTDEVIRLFRERVG